MVFVSLIVTENVTVNHAGVIASSLVEADPVKRISYSQSAYFIYVKVKRAAPRLCGWDGDLEYVGGHRT